MIKEIIKYAAANLWHRKTRSFLTILSILIGITAIFSLSSFGLGIYAFVQDYGKQAGTDKLLMMPKDAISSVGDSKSAFTDDELNFIKKIQGVDEVAGMLIAHSKVKFKDYKEIYTFAIGIPSGGNEQRLVGEMFSIIELIKGRNIKKGDIFKVVLGYNYFIPNKIFKKAVSVGDKIIINDVEVEVVGFFKEIGNPADDAQIYFSNEAMKKIFKKTDYEYLILRSAPGQDAVDLADKIKEKFRKYRNQEKGQEDFFVQTFEQVMQTYSSILNILVGILVLIALISVLVAAVNITNTMYTSILERTREIGVMKSIGAKNRFIMLVFMTESGILGGIGGIVGIFFGYLIAKAGGYVAAYYGISMLKPAFPVWLIIGCALFAFLVGVFAGLFPSRQASKLNPVDALRYE